MSDWPPFKSNSTPEVKRGQKVATGLNILDSLGLGVHCSVYSVICTMYKTYLEYLVIYVPKGVDKKSYSTEFKSQR